MIIGPGSILGGYLIERQLGSGGMGTVYLARHPALPRHDALKVLWPHLASDPEYRARFEREANIAAALDHPNIVSVLNKGEDQGCLWIALQYVNGTDADSALARDAAAMTPDRVLHVVTEIGKGLDHAHRAGLLHRDIKPANFLLASGTPGEERVLLADFGIAKPSEDATQLTKTGTFLATLAFASPEQLSGQPLDSRSDIYSLGCSFYRLLVNQNPYPGTQPLNVMMGHINDPIPRITAIRPDLPRALDEVLARVLAKSPADRYSTCAEFSAAAAAALSGRSARVAATELNSASNSPFAALAAASAAERAAAARAARTSEPPASSRDRRGPVLSFAQLASDRRDSGRMAETKLNQRRQSETDFDTRGFAGVPAPLLTPFQEPLFGSEGSARQSERRVDWSRWKGTATALGAGIPMLAVVALTMYGCSHARDSETATAATTRPTPVSTTTADGGGLQDPCQLLDPELSYGADRFGLQRTGIVENLTDTRNCTWHPVNSGEVSGTITISRRPMADGPDSEPVLVAGTVDALLVRTPVNGSQDNLTCAVTWSTSYGSVRVAMSNFLTKVGADELCRTTRRMADRVYPRTQH